MKNIKIASKNIFYKIFFIPPLLKNDITMCWLAECLLILNHTPYLPIYFLNTRRELHGPLS